MMPLSGWHAAARSAFAAALEAGHPRAVTTDAMARLDVPPTFIIAIGKAAAAMAQAVRDTGCTAPGIVVTHDEGFAEIDGMRCFASAHPVPDSRGLAAGEAVISAASELSADDHLLLLISGGGSALLPAPADGVTLEDKMALNAALLASGLDIHAMNAVRRLFSRLKGGRLARLAAPARITQFLLSDVPGDRLESIGSGPAVGDPVPLEQVLAMIAEHALDRLDVVSRMVTRIADGTADLPLREGDPALRRVESHLLASNDLCRTAATASLAAHFAGAGRLDLPELAGDAATLARSLAQSLAQSLAYQKADSSSSGSVLFGVTGGETTVTLDKMSGKGGRAQEMVLAFADEMHRLGTQAPPRWLVLVGGTDGRDGPTDCAGAMIGAADAFDAAAAAGALRNHDSYAYLAAHDQLLEAVPTGTNLGDIAIFFAAGTLNEE